jgi:hypothetical protein
LKKNTFPVSKVRSAINIRKCSSAYGACFLRSPNRTVYAKRRSVLGYEKPQSALRAFVGFFSATFWPAATLRVASWAGQNVIYSRNVKRNESPKFLKRCGDLHVAVKDKM